jgi:hypothetical protein
MKRLKLFFACLLMAVLSIGQVWGDADVTYDFTGSGWTVSSGTLSDGTVSFTGAGSANFKMNTGYFMMGKSGAYINFPTYAKAVEKIVVTGNSGASGSTTMNIYVGETAVSTETTGSTGTNTYNIASASQAAGTTYTLKVTSNHNAQITKIEVFYASGSSKTLESVTVSGAPTKTSYTAGEDFNPDGLTVMGHYSDNSDEAITSGITWAYNPSQTLVKDQTSIGVIATVNSIASAEYNVTGLTVTAASPKITITQDEVADFTNTYAQYTWTAGGVSGKMYAYKNAGMQFNSSKTGYYVYNTDAIPGRITKITMTKASGTDRTWTPYVSTTAMTSASGTALDAKSVTTSGVSWDVTGSNSYFYITVAGGSTVIGSIVIEYTEEAGPAIDAPSISGDVNFVGSTTVTITHDDADHIYYTTNGVDPTTSSTEYTVPFTVDADGTTIVKAIAVKGGDVSAVASKEFEKVASYTTLADIFTKATEVGNTATDIYVTFGGWKVSAKTSNNVFLTDGTNGAVIYGSGHGFNAGDVLTGTAACKVQLYKGFAELTSLNSSTTGLTVTSGSVGDPVVKTWDQLSAVNTGALVKLENLTYDGSKLTDGNDNTIPTYTTFYTASFETGKSYNLVGVYQYYNTDGQILPRSAADVQEIIETFTVTYNNAPDHGTLTIKNGDEVVTSGSAVNEGTVLTIETTPAEDYKLAGITVNGSAYAESTLTLTENVTIAASFEEDTAPEVETYILSEAGVQTSHLVSGMRVGDKVNLPLTAAECNKVFRGWSENASCAVAPEYAPGALYSLKADNKLYAVYATATPGAVTNYPIDFENETTDYTDWSFDNMTSQGTNSGVTAHGGSYFGTTGGKATASVTTTAKIANPSSITFYVSKQSTNTTASNWKVEVSADGSDWTQVGDAQSATSMSKGEWIEVTRDLSAHSDVYVRVYYGSNTAVRCIDDLVLSAQGPDSYSDYSTDCQAQVKTPTFSPAAGTYNAVQNVTISSETTGATIYYTTNGDEPTASSTEYTSAITVDADMTIKAIAVKDGMANSAVATAAYTINLPLSTMDQIFAAATAAGNTATDVNITFGNWVVSGVSTNAKNVFVTDGTKGLIIYDGGASMGFAAGDVLSGTVACKVQLYKGAAELTTLSSATEGLNIATGGSVTPEVKAISALSGINTGAPVTINSVQFDGEYLTDGVNSIKPFNSLFAYDALENGKYYNVTGIYQQFDATKEILPRSAADIEEVNLEDPELSYSPASVSLEVGQALSAPTFNNPHDVSPINYAVSGDAVATVTNEGVISLVENATGTATITASFAGNAQYAAGNATFTITVTPASVSENVVVLAEHNSKFYAMTTTITNETAVPVEVEYDGTKVTVAKDADKDAIQWTKKTIGENITFQTKDEDKLYLKGTSGGATLSLNATACNWAWDGTNNCYVTGTRGFIYRISTNGFKNYGVSNLSNADYVAPQVIVIDPENIVITSKVSAELAYDPESDEITEGDAWSAPSLVNPHSVTITSYATDNDAVATVTDGGVIALAGGIGTAHITAHFDGDASYLEGDAVYTITVNAVPEPADVCDGTDDFLDTEDKGSPTSYTDRSTPNGWSAVNAGYKVIEEKAYWMINGKTTAVGVITSPELTGGLGTLKFRYANTNSESNGVSVKIEIKQGDDVVKEYTLTKANSEVVQNTVYTETIENINVAGNFQIVITNLSPSNNTGNKDRVSIGRFCWTGYTAPEPPVVDYTEVRNGLTEGWYYTMCLDKEVTAVQGGSIWRVLSKAANGTDVILEEVIGTLDAGRPYIFRAAASTLEVAYTGAAVDAPVTEGNNGLIGSFTQKSIDQSNDNYIIWDNALYFVNTDNVYVGAHRAYLNMNDVPAYSDEPQQGSGAPRRRVVMTVHGEQTATGCENINASETPVKMIINGQMYILRGEKMYDATGKLVK